MSLTAILDEVKKHGIILEVQGDQLRYRARKGSLTAELREALVRHKPQIIAALTASKPSAKARIRGADELIETAHVDVCFHCRGAKVCKCICCAVATRSMQWEPGQCQSCKGTGYLVSADLERAGEIKLGCPGSEKCTGCYSIGAVDGRERFLHPPRGKAIDWTTWPPATKVIQ